ncbi:hypothetical protein [Burkholderia ubonensis]|uniref:hypothetical protein n=1 Tax=Burkholderia ubonensis TaxID=101571 RepID=UPI0012FAE996|nr:hypothetical protein [Burkholderia ubonensis]
MANDNDTPDVSGLTPNMESFEGIRNLRPDMTKSFVGVAALRPSASNNASAAHQNRPAAPGPLASVTTQPIAGNNPTTKGK